MTCYQCQSTEHATKQCPKLFYAKLPKPCSLCLRPIEKGEGKSQARGGLCVECIESKGWLKSVMAYQPADLNIGTKPNRPHRKGVPLPDGPRPAAQGPAPGDNGKAITMHIYIYPEDKAMLLKMAEAYSLSASGMIARMLRTHKVITLMLDAAKDRGKDPAL